VRTESGGQIASEGPSPCQLGDGQRLPVPARHHEAAQDHLCDGVEGSTTQHHIGISTPRSPLPHPSHVGAVLPPYRVAASSARAHEPQRPRRQRRGRRRSSNEAIPAWACRHRAPSPLPCNHRGYLQGCRAPAPTRRLALTDGTRVAGGTFKGWSAMRGIWGRGFTYAVELGVRAAGQEPVQLRQQTDVRVLRLRRSALRLAHVAVVEINTHLECCFCEGRAQQQREITG